jgi:hypothetical protein
MSYSSLWGIDGKWSGKRLTEYHNSWLFCPITWNVLLCKYIKPEERTGYGRVWTNYMSWVGICDSATADKKWRMLNERINNSGIQPDRVLWDLSQLGVFDTKDKDFVAECIDKFVENNIVGNPEYQESDHIIERFHKVAEDIRNLPRRFKYFVIKGTSVDDEVERWFYRKRLCSWKEAVCYFTVIEDQKVVGYATNLQMCKGEE